MFKFIILFILLLLNPMVGCQWNWFLLLCRDNSRTRRIRNHSWNQAGWGRCSWLCSEFQGGSCLWGSVCQSKELWNWATCVAKGFNAHPWGTLGLYRSLLAVKCPSVHVWLAPWTSTEHRGWPGTSPRPRTPRRSCGTWPWSRRSTRLPTGTKRVCNLRFWWSGRAGWRLRALPRFPCRSSCWNPFSSCATFALFRCAFSRSEFQFRGPRLLGFWILYIYREFEY